MIRKLLIGHIVRWVARAERRILRNGRPLTDVEKQSARMVGVKDVDKVRVMAAKEVPIPLASRVLAYSHFPPSQIYGVAYGHGIYVMKSYETDLPLIVHELVHVAQCEREGGILNFVPKYIEQCLSKGYYDAEFEQEAYLKEQVFIH